MIAAASDVAAGQSFELVEDLPALISVLQNSDPDYVFVDFELPDLGGIKGLPLVRAAARGRPVGVFVSGASLELARRVASLGVQALLPRRLSAEGFLTVIKLLDEGYRLTLTEAAGSPLETHQRAAQLSERELQVLVGLCDGLQNKEIAHDFDVQEVTVKMHVRAIIRKLGARNRTHAAMIARDLGIC